MLKDALLPDDLYNRDALAWSERQAALLCRLSRGERLNEAVDWPNLIEDTPGQKAKPPRIGAMKRRSFWMTRSSGSLHPLRRVRATADDSGVPQSPPETCPLTLDELLAGNIAELVIKLRAAA